jgi:hypothetical protein
MTFAEKVEAVRNFGYTPGQATFLVHVAMHSGYFLRRQIGGGKCADDLLRKAKAYQHVRIEPLGNAQLIHISAAAVYRAIGLPSARQEVRELSGLREKLMALDYVVAHPEYTFLSAREDKLAYLNSLGVPESILPRVQGKAALQGCGKYPVRIDPAGRPGLCFVEDGIGTPPAFRTWLGQYRPVLELLRTCDVVVIACLQSGLRTAERRFLREFPGSVDALPRDVLAYFTWRREAEASNYAALSMEELNELNRLRYAQFSQAKYEDQYLLWLAGATEPATSNDIQFHSFLVPHSYRIFGLLESDGKLNRTNGAGIDRYTRHREVTANV